MRKRKLLSRVVAPVALAFSVFLIATPGAGATGADVYGVGGGSINFAGGKKAFKFSFSAHTGPQGDFGSYRFTIEPPFAPLDAHVDVDCVNVFPNPPGDPLSQSARRGWLDRRADKESHSAAELVRPKAGGSTAGRDE
jgi:hypothetical protein